MTSLECRVVCSFSEERDVNHLTKIHDTEVYRIGQQNGPAS